jgi:thiol-disulfide isomerase/thioredoxin
LAATEAELGAEAQESGGEDVTRVNNNDTIPQTVADETSSASESSAHSHEEGEVSEARDAHEIDPDEADNPLKGNRTWNATALAEGDLNPTNGSTEAKVECIPRNDTNPENPGVNLVNSTGIAEYLESEPNATQSRCALVLFFYPWCPFSAKTAPHFNALGRIYPQLHVLALDAYAHNSINMRFGLVGIPSILLFRNGKMVAKFNDSDPSVEGFVSFVQKVTGLSPELEPVVLEEDNAGPVPTVPEKRLDLVLLLSWLFIGLCFAYFFGTSTLFKRIAESVRNNWREAEAQREHLD